MPPPNPVPIGRFVVGMLATAISIPALLLIDAGDWRWIEGWIFAAWFDVMILFNGIYL